MKRTLFIGGPLFVVIVLLLGGCFGLFNHFPSGALEAIARDPGLIVYAIDPTDGPRATPGIPAFHDWPILGQTVLSRPQEREALTDSLRRAARGAWDSASCFNPRHAIRAAAGNETYDILLCFECGQAAVYLPDGRVKWMPIRGGADALNHLLNAAQVQLTR